MDTFRNGLRTPPFTNICLGGAGGPPCLGVVLVDDVLFFGDDFFCWAGARGVSEAGPVDCHCFSLGGAALSLQNPGCAARQKRHKVAAGEEPGYW